MSDPQVPRGPHPSADDTAPPLPGPPPPLPDLAAVSASIDPLPAAAPLAAPVVAPVVAPSSPSAAASAPAAPSVSLIDAQAVPTAPHVEQTVSDAAAVPTASRVPGAVGYGRLPTAPTVTTLRGPAEGETADWDDEPSPRQRAVVAPWALALAIVALAASFVVGWMLPLGLAAVVVGIVALRRPVESRSIATWAIVLGAVSMLYSAGWLLWAAWQLDLMG